jgi:hypothetical protein
MDIIHHLMMIKIIKIHEVSENGICLRHQVTRGVPTLRGPIERASLNLRTNWGGQVKEDKEDREKMNTWKISRREPITNYTK